MYFPYFCTVLIFFGCDSRILLTVSISRLFSIICVCVQWCFLITVYNRHYRHIYLPPLSVIVVVILKHCSCIKCHYFPLQCKYSELAFLKNKNTYMYIFGIRLSCIYVTWTLSCQNFHIISHLHKLSIRVYEMLSLGRHVAAAILQLTSLWQLPDVVVSFPRPPFVT